ncbi:MAG TPA: cysteine dioxygenase family protein [Candidatus Kapabacteria bacterium]|nr:cysteine dioxygenase family protein [Candidatus Kapabacteria bacterium]
MASTIELLTQALDSAADYSPQTLERILQEYLPSEAEIAALAEGVFPYGRTMLKLTDEYEMIIGCWPRGGWCDVHDHGEAVGIVYSYGGEIEHFEYRLNDGCLELFEQTTIRSGDFKQLTAGMIHSLQNISSDAPYIGLHIYSPPTSDVRVFDVHKGDIYHVTDDAFAIIPKDERCIRAVEVKCFSYKNLVREKETHAV